MNREIHRYFEEDHERLDEIFEKATADPNNVDMELYHEFRVGLLTHIKMEEKILFKMAQQENENTPLPMAKQLRLEHGALTTLMVVPPTPEVIKVIQNLLKPHNVAEEKEGGMYDQCEAKIASHLEEIKKELDAVTDVPVHPINEHPIAMKAARNSVERAGYNFDELAHQ